jgi:hypothetical protein
MRPGSLTVCLCTLGLASVVAGINTTEECATVLTPQQIALERERIRTGWIYKIPEKTRAIYYIPLTIHIVRSSSGAGGFDSANITPAFDDLNLCFQNTDMRFYIPGAIDFVDDDYFFYDLTSMDKFDSLRQTNTVPNTINIYIVPLISGFPGGGMSSFTTDAVQGVIVRESHVGTPDNPSTLAHEVGHYFDLYHTHTLYFGAECPEGAGCDTLGDLLCDTPADPNLIPAGVYHVSEYPECAYDNYITVPDLPHCDQMTPYDPPTDNVMSYSRPLCRTILTRGQADRALLVLLTAENRKNLYTAAQVPSLGIHGIAAMLLLMLSIGGWLLRKRSPIVRKT